MKNDVKVSSAKQNTQRNRMEEGASDKTEGVFQISGFTFTSNFDSGNLGHVQLCSDSAVCDSDSDSGCEPSTSHPNISSSTVQPRSAGIENPDYQFQLWTKPDCSGTEFENGNRTWFYFGLRGGPVGAVLKFTVMNLNKQAKLFSQGMAPVFKIQGKTSWERIRDPPSYTTLENNFSLSFKFRMTEDPHCQLYFAFTYPYTYKELQTDLSRLEKKHSTSNLPWTSLCSLPTSSIYFHREMVTKSIENRRIDLITISGMNNICKDQEPLLTNLFPDQNGSKRPHKFTNKKTVFLSARVHPGETCSSYVMNGFIKFLLNSSDARAVALRSKYVFKLLPMLNPDGVYRGHYRTDTRGVNLNRVYVNPSPVVHPTIYAAKKLIMLAHLGVAPAEQVITSHSKEELPGPVEECEEKKTDLVSDVHECTDDSGSGVNLPTFGEPEWYKPLTLWDLSKTSGRGRTSNSSRVSNSSRTSHSSGVSGSGSVVTSTPVKGESSGQQWYEMTETSRCSEGDESVADFSVGPSFGIGAMLSSAAENKFDNDAFLPPEIPSSPSKRSRLGRTSFAGVFDNKDNSSVDSNCNVSVKSDLTAPTGESGLFLYVDIHGHASKRGIFMYGNHFEELETKVSALLYPKLMSINFANFDFPACNFSAKNMYMKDRHTGAGKEGSGRVSVFKATGLIYCYTLECNFNTGRFTNSIPLSSRDCGRASPPPIYDNPPKYCPEIFEQCGRYMAVSILDLTESNPWTRLPCSSCKTLKGVRSSIKQWIKSAEAEAAAKNNKVTKASPMRTRLRSLSANPKKSPSKKKNLAKSPSSPDLVHPSHSTKPLSKQTRKNISPKLSQSVTIPPKVGRQNSRQNSAKSETSQKKKKIGTGKKLKNSKLVSGNSKIASKPNSRSGSRASSPKRNKPEAKVSRGKSAKKSVLQKAAMKTLEEPSNSESLVINKKLKLKRRKKKTSNVSN